MNKEKPSKRSLLVLQRMYQFIKVPKMLELCLQNQIIYDPVTRMKINKMTIITTVNSDG